MRNLIAISILAIILIPTASSAQEGYVAPTKVGIIGALDIEIELYLDELEVYDVTDIGGLNFYEGVLGGQPAVVVKSGVGKVYSALGATLLIHEFEVDAVIFSGVAGGVDPSLNVGDIIVADKLLQHDYGLHSPEDFKWWDNSFIPHLLLTQVAYQAAKNTQFPTEMFEGVVVNPQVVQGTIVTGDQFIQSDEYVDWLYETFDASCTEMEGASVAAICEKFNVPYTVIRCLSDRADDVADVDFEKFAPYAAKACSLIVLELLKEVAGIQKELLSESS